MTIQEFSSIFDTMLASYNATANFGEEHSKQEITLNEYEKSVFLTQAQDVVLKNYIFAQNTVGGLDDNSKKQIEFSSLQVVADMEKLPSKDYVRTSVRIDDYSCTTITGYTTDALGTDLEGKGNPVIAGIEDDGLVLLYGDGTKVTLTDVEYGGESLVEDNLFTAKRKCTATFTGKGGTDGFTFYTDAADDDEMASTSVMWKIVYNCKAPGKTGTTGLGLGYVANGYSVKTVGTTETYEPTGEQMNLYQLQTAALDGTKVEAGDWFTWKVAATGNYEVPSIVSTGKDTYDPAYSDEYKQNGTLAYDDRGVLYKAPGNLLFIMNERMKDTRGRNYTVVPISYDEYDRRMSEPYTQPLKKQCWRIMHSSDSVVYELIPIKGVTPALYRSCIQADNATAL